MGQDREIIVLIDQSGQHGGNVLGREPVRLRSSGPRRRSRRRSEGAKVHLGLFRRSRRDAKPQARVDFQRQPGYAAPIWPGPLLGARRLPHIEPATPKTVSADRSSAHGSKPLQGFPANVEVEVVELGKPLMAISPSEGRVVQPTIRRKSPMVVTAQSRMPGAARPRHSGAALFAGQRDEAADHRKRSRLRRRHRSRSSFRC